MDATLILKHLSLLGFKVKDRVTGAEGIVTGIDFDLYGCVQAALNRGLDKDGKPIDQSWYDVSRLQVISKAPVMAVPNYISGNQAEGRQGADAKPPLHRF